MYFPWKICLSSYRSWYCLSSSPAVENFFQAFYSLVFCIYVLLQLSNSFFVKLSLSVSILFTGLKIKLWRRKKQIDIRKARPGYLGEMQKYNKHQPPHHHFTLSTCSRILFSWCKTILNSTTCFIRLLQDDLNNDPYFNIVILMTS